MKWDFGKKSVFPAQREDDDETVKVSRAAWDQMQQSLGALGEKLTKLERKASRPSVVTEPAPKTRVALHEPKLDLAGLPDPVTDKDGFLREASKRLQTQLDTFVATVKGQKDDDDAAARVSAAQGAKIGKLWKRWTKEHPEFSKMGKIVQAEAAAMIQEGAAQGQGLDAVMFADEDGFLDDLAERVKGAAEEMGLKVEKPAPERDPSAAAADVDAGLSQFADQFKGKDDAATQQRAMDLHEGDLGSLTPKKGGKQEDKPIPLTEQLKAAQEHMGL